MTSYDTAMAMAMGGDAAHSNSSTTATATAAADRRRYDVANCRRTTVGVRRDAYSSSSRRRAALCSTYRPTPQQSAIAASGEQRRQLCRNSFEFALSESSSSSSSAPLSILSPIRKLSPALVRRQSPHSSSPAAAFGYSQRHRSARQCCAFVIMVLTVLVQRLAVPADAQRISTQPQTFKVRVGDSVQLPCNFAELDDEDKVVVWKRGMDVLAIDEELTISDTRFQVKKDGLNYVLEISAIESYDSSDYTCSVTSNPPIEITHKLEVNVSPSVKLIPSTSPLLARVGEEVIVKCAGSGNPPPAIKWRKQNAAANAPPVPTDGAGGAALRISQATTADSGVYECRAANSVGDDATAVVEIRVESLGGTSTESSTENADESAVSSAPWVETDMTYIPVRLGAPANLSCRYDGAPEPTADWLFSGFKISNFDSKFKGSAKYASRVKNHSVTTFSIGEVHEDHFGDYTCKIANTFGTAERIMHLSGRPGPPAITVLSDNALYWTVQSAQPISEYKVYYRFASADTWVDHKLYKSSKDDQQGEFWTHKVVLDFLKPDTDYELQVNAKNELGWGSLARSFVKYHSSSASGKITSDALGKNVNAASKMAAQGIRCLLTRLALSTILLVLPAAMILL